MIDDSSAFSSLAAIGHVYPPLAFTGDVDPTDTAGIEAFITGNVTPIAFNAARYSVGLLNELFGSYSITQAHKDLTDFSNVETIVEGGTYSIFLAAEDVTGNVGVGQLVGTSVSRVVSEYPPALLNNFTTNVTGQTYGNGTYVVDSSAYYNNMPPYKAFDKKNESVEAQYIWASTPPSSAWLTIKLPNAIMLDSYSIQGRQSPTQQTPTAWSLYG